MEGIKVMDANGTPPYDNGSVRLDNDLQVSETLGDEFLEDLDSYLEDINDRLTISRMVSDSVTMGMVNAVEQEAVEKIARKELEVAKLRDMLPLYHVGADEKESFGAPLMHHESKSTSHCRMCYNFSDTFVKHDSMRESLGSLRSTAKEQFKKLKKEIESIKGCSSIKRISSGSGSGSELLGLGGILQEKVPERWIDVDRTLESLKATVDTAYKQAEDMFQLPKASLCAWQLEQVVQAEIEVMVNKTCIRGLQEEFEKRLFDQSAQFYGNESVNLHEKIKEISSLREELNAISKSLFLSEFGQLTSLGSLEIGEEWNNDKGTNHFHRKVLSNHVSSSTLIWEGNGKHEEPSSNIPENSDHAQLKRMSKEELITEMTKMKRNHESKVQEMTEENFRLKRELLRLTERGSSLPLKKDKDFDMLRKKIPHFISKLDDILVENEKLNAVSENAENHGSVKDRLESLLSENRQLRDSLTDKKKEVKYLSSQVGDAADKMSQHHLIEANLLCAIEDAHIEALICEDVYKCLLMGLMGQFQCITEESDLEYNIVQEVYEIILKEASCIAEPTRKFEIEDSDMEPIVMQGLCGIIFREALKTAEEELRNLNMKYLNENEIRVSLEMESLKKEEAFQSEVADKEKFEQEMLTLAASIEEKDRLVQETTAALVKEKEQSKLTSQELEYLKDQTSQHQILLNQKLELAMKRFGEVDEEKHTALSLAEAKETEHVKQMESIIIFVQGLLEAVADFENRVTEDISSIILRLENLSSESRLLMNKANMLQKTGHLYKQRFKRRCSDLEKAEAEVDLLGDEVDELLSLLEKIYIALDHYSPILKHYPGIIDILKLVRRELSGESTRAV